MRETEGLINEGLSSTPQNEYQNLSQGTGGYQGLLSEDSGTNQNLSYGDQALSSAIKQKYSKPYQLQQQGMQNKMQLDARNAHLEKMRVAHHMANEEANLNFQKELVKYKQKKMKQAQRSQLLGQVLGLVGGVVGGIYGGPTGAAAGSQVGGIAGSESQGGGNIDGFSR